MTKKPGDKAGELQPSMPMPRPIDQPSSLVDLVDALMSIPTDGPLAALNASSITDNNGGRIQL